MNNSFFFIVVISILLLLLSGCQGTPITQPIWEYIQVDILCIDTADPPCSTRGLTPEKEDSSAVDILNDLGDIGWELVDVHLPNSYGIIERYTFKRLER